MSTAEAYGTITDGDGAGAGAAAGGVRNHNMNLAFTTNDGVAVYKPAIPQSSAQNPAPATPTQAYQAGSSGNGSAAATSREQSKRKRGRPRKYPLDGTVTPRVTAPPPPRPEPAFSSPAPMAEVAFSSPAPVAEAAFSTPAPVAEAVFSSPAPVAEVAFSSPAPVAAASSVPGKKARGRPRGSGQKQHVAPIGAAGWSAGVGFSPHVITIKAGEDVSSKIMSFSQSGAQTICVLAANGAISNVTLRQAATSGGSVTYEGRFEILSLSGSYTVLESGGQRSRTGGLSVLLAGPDGRVLGGGVAGLLIAAAPVQVIVGGFLPAQEFKAPIQADPVASAPPKLNHGASAAGSPTSRGTLSESSGGGSGSPLNQSTGAYNNSNNPQGMTTFSWK